MSNALSFQKWFSRFVILFVIWNCFGLRLSVHLEQGEASFSLFIKEAPGLKFIYIE